MTILQHVGNVFKKILGIAVTVAKDAEPIVDLAFPAIAPLYNSALGLAIGAEGMAPTLTGTGPQKLQQLVAGLLPAAQQFAIDNKIAWPEAEIEKWASAVVDTINMIPGPTVIPVTPATTA